jgi:hypothetical protein
MTKKVIDINLSWLLFLLCFLEFIGNYGVSNFLWSDEIYLSNFTGSDFDEYIESIRNIDLLRYLIMPFYLLAKTFFLAAVFFGALVLWRKQLQFRDFFAVSIVAEFSFVLSDFTKIIWFLVFNSSYSASELKDFHPFSLTHLLGMSGDWMDLILKTINVWHILYVVIWVMGLIRIGVELRDALLYSSITYGVLLILWIVVRLFLSLNFS